MTDQPLEDRDDAEPDEVAETGADGESEGEQILPDE